MVKPRDIPDDTTPKDVLVEFLAFAERWEMWHEDVTPDLRYLRRQRLVWQDAKYVIRTVIIPIAIVVGAAWVVSLLV